MSRGVVVVALLLALAGACSDDTPPKGAAANSSVGVASGSDAALARSMARTLADGFQQGANGRISSAQADCLVGQISSRVRTHDLASIASTQPEPKTLTKDVRTEFGDAFDACLSSDIAKQLRQQFGL